MPKPKVTKFLEHNVVNKVFHDAKYIAIDYWTEYWIDCVLCKVIL